MKLSQYFTNNDLNAPVRFLVSLDAWFANATLARNLYNVSIQCIEEGTGKLPLLDDIESKHWQAWIPYSTFVGMPGQLSGGLCRGRKIPERMPSMDCTISSKSPCDIYSKNIYIIFLKPSMSRMFKNLEDQSNSAINYICRSSKSRIELHWILELRLQMTHVGPFGNIQNFAMSTFRIFYFQDYLSFPQIGTFSISPAIIHPFEAACLEQRDVRTPRSTW